MRNKRVLEESPELQRARPTMCSRRRRRCGVTPTTPPAATARAPRATNRQGSLRRRAAVCTGEVPAPDGEIRAGPAPRAAAVQPPKQRQSPVRTRSRPRGARRCTAEEPTWPRTRRTRTSSRSSSPTTARSRKSSPSSNAKAGRQHPQGEEVCSHASAPRGTRYSSGQPHPRPRHGAGRPHARRRLSGAEQYAAGLLRFPAGALTPL